MTTDPHDWMLELSSVLAEAGPPCTQVESDLRDVAMLDVLVAPDGFNGWLAYVSCERMAGTLAGLERIGCPEVAAIVRRALDKAGVDPAALTDEEKDALVVDGVNADDEDDEFYDRVEDCMTTAFGYATAHAEQIRLPIPE